MKKGIFLVLGVVLIALVGRALYLQAQDGELSQDVVRVSVDGGLDSQEIVLGKGQDFGFSIKNSAGKDVSFVDVKSDLFLGKIGHILSLVGEIESGEHALNVVSQGKIIYEKTFNFKAKEEAGTEFVTEDKGITLARKFVNGKVDLVIKSNRDMVINLDEYVAQQLEVSSVDTFTSYVKNGLQNIRFEISLTKDEEKIIEYELKDGKNRAVYSFGPAEIYEVSVNDDRYTRQKVLSEGGIRWISSKNFSWVEGLVTEEKELSESGWFEVGNVLIKNDKNRIIYKSNSAGSEASYEVDSLSDVDNVPLLMGKYRAYITENILTVFEEEKRQEEGVERIKYSQIFP